MTDRHEAALRAALAERDRIGRDRITALGYYTYYPHATDYNVTRIVEAALAAADAHDDGPCRTCGGHGWVTVPEHGCGGNEQICAELCPVPVQAQCPDCAQREPEASSMSNEEPW